jgi:WD40 repeat protein
MQPETADPAIVRMAMSRSGRWLAAGTARGAVAVFDAARRTGPRRFQARPGPLNDLQFSPDERWLAVANRNLTLWPTEGAGASVLLRGDDNNYGTVAFHPVEARLLATTGSGAVLIIELPSGRTAAAACCS